MAYDYAYDHWGETEEIDQVFNGNASYIHTNVSIPPLQRCGNWLLELAYKGGTPVGNLIATILSAVKL